MSRKNFVSLVIGTIGLLLFGIGMCMCLMPQWGVFNQGVAVGCIGAVALLAGLIVRRKMEGKAPIKITPKAVGTVLLAITGALTLGVGMCMAMVWQNLMIQGIVVGIIGIILLLALIPVTKGVTQ